MGRVPPEPPIFDKHGLAKSDRIRIREVAVRSAADAIEINPNNVILLSKNILEIATELERFIITGEK